MHFEHKLYEMSTDISQIPDTKPSRNLRETNEGLFSKEAPVRVGVKKKQQKLGIKQADKGYHRKNIKKRMFRALALYNFSRVR